MTEQVQFLNARFDNMTFEEAVERLLQRALSRQGGRIFFANAHTIVTASRQPELVDVLNDADLVLADGSGVRWGSKLVGTPIPYNLNGTDLIPALARAGAAERLSVFLLGAGPGVAEAAAENLQRASPGLVIAGVQHGYFDPAELPQVIERIRDARPHVLLVALGVPAQELWVHAHAQQLPGVTCIAVGGLFDFLAQRVRRAPRWVQAIGMEWAWRLAMEPGRLWRRYLIGNVIFIQLVVQRLSSGRLQTR